MYGAGKPSAHLITRDCLWLRERKRLNRKNTQLAAVLTLRHAWKLEEALHQPETKGTTFPLPYSRVVLAFPKKMLPDIT